MPLTLEEKVQSRRTVTDKYDKLQSVTLLYVLKGTDDDAEVKQFVMDETDEIYLGLLPRDTIDFDPDWVDTDSGTGQWQVAVRYRWTKSRGSIRIPEPDAPPVVTFDTRGGTKHLTHSIATVAKQPPDAADYKKLIGWDGERVKGVDVPVSEYTFALTYCKNPAFVTDAYKEKLLLMSGTVNNAGFKGHEAGEVFFIGAVGSQRGDDNWEIAYHFAGSPNKTGIVYGELPGIDKGGWEHIWLRLAEKVVGTELVPAPIAVYVEQVLYTSNFSDLGIGV